MQRYKLDCNVLNDERIIVEIVESNHGDFVSYLDASSIIDDLRDKIAELEDNIASLETEIELANEE